MENRKLNIYLSKELLEQRIKNLIYSMKWYEENGGEIDSTIFSNDLIAVYHYSKNSDNQVKYLMDFFMPFRASQQAAGYDIKYLPEILIDESMENKTIMPNFYFPHNEEYFVGEIKKIADTALKITKISIDEWVAVDPYSKNLYTDLNNFDPKVSYPIQEIQLRARSGLAYKYGVGLYNGIGTIDTRLI